MIEAKEQSNFYQEFKTRIILHTFYASYLPSIFIDTVRLSFESVVLEDGRRVKLKRIFFFDYPIIHLQFSTLHYSRIPTL